MVLSLDPAALTDKVYRYTGEYFGGPSPTHAQNRALSAAPLVAILSDQSPPAPLAKADPRTDN